LVNGPADFTSDLCYFKLFHYRFYIMISRYKLFPGLLHAAVQQQVDREAV
jgi:hypothetical protein